MSGAEEVPVTQEETSPRAPTASGLGPTSTISTPELQRRLSDPELTIVDVRPLHAYNGWRISGEARGGHIPGAVAFPSAWLASVHRAEAARLLQTKGVVQGREVVLYGDAAGVSAVARRLAELGHRRILVYDAGWGEWAGDSSLPVERLAHFEQLVHVDWLHSLLGGGRPEAAPAGPFLLFHVNFGVPEEYAESHLPGALHLDTNRLESPSDWNRRSPRELDEALCALGVTVGTTVILYGRDTEGDPDEKWPGRRAGQISAMRAATILRYCGVGDVRLLDGGYDAWARAGHPLEATMRAPVPVPSFGAKIPRRPDVIVDLDEAKQILADPDHAALVSVRTWDEHIGRVSGYDYIRPAGRIAGDVWGNCGSDAYHMQHYRTVDNTMRAYPEIASNWREAAITPDKWVAFYCGTGWRASEAWFYAYLMGWPRIAVYDGGWYEWSRDPSANAILVGEPEDRTPTPSGAPGPLPPTAAA
ncbi:MAG: rhodanese-like domain-containing protein [Thermoleophilia bacterium]|nr:rhodanese-like domain-containing protein [Thermoleophilia bacterium]MDH5332893.1 rhodanese-like domain-containing protein [Thermoleophilia bacterium]